MDQNLINLLNHSGVTALIPSLFFFLLGTFVKWKKHVGSLNTDIVSQLTAENKALQTLNESKDKDLDTLKKQVEAMAPQLQYCENLLKNRNPAVEQFIFDARRALNIPEGVQLTSSQ